jgi:hypothetical protein
MARIIVASGIVLFVLAFPWYILSHHTLGTSAATSTPSTSIPAFTYTNATASDISVQFPKPGGSVTSTIIITGYAKSSWFFEGVFPVEVKNTKDIVIGTGQAKAQGTWTIDRPVAFIAELDIKAPYNGMVTVTLRKDNPSGEPARDASLAFPLSIE